MPLVLGFGAVLTGVILSVAGVTASSVGSVARGKPDHANARKPKATEGEQASAQLSSTGGTAAPVKVTGSLSQEAFARALLTSVGVTPTRAAVEKMLAWMRQEGGHWQNTAKYNPLNTTLTMPGSTVMAGGSAAGVQSYNSWQQGLEATVKTLDGYPQIIAALKTGSLSHFESVVTDSPWGTRF